jgi:hypothetical protein
VSKRNYSAPCDRHNRRHDRPGGIYVGQVMVKVKLAEENRVVAEKLAERHTPAPPRRRPGSPQIKHSDEVVARCLEMKEQGYKRRFIVEALGITTGDYDRWIQGYRNPYSASDAKRAKR